MNVCRKDVRTKHAWSRISSSTRAWIVIALAAVVAFSVPMSKRLAVGADTLAGSQGTDTSLALTDSAVMAQGRGPYASMRLTINETRDLVNQAISVSWTGAPPTFSDEVTRVFGNTFSGDFVQIFQCWGDPDPADPLNAVNPGPPPTQCQFGAESNNPTTSYPIREAGFAYSRVLSQPTWPNFDATPGWVDQSTGYKIQPFKAVDGRVVNQQADYNAANDPLHPKGFWLNPYFSFNTSNEIPYARTYPDSSGELGHGEQLFQVQTGLEAPGLGCGQRLQPAAGGKKRPRCWLVVVPRGAPADENPSGVTGLTTVKTSPLAPAAWANRIAIPLEFKPVDSTCQIGTGERRIVGSELAVGAITSWQPALCAKAGARPVSFSYLSDDRARQNLTEQGFGGAGMSVFSLPPEPSTLDPTHPVVAAPLTLSSVVIGFNVERTPTLGSDGQPNPDEQPLAGTRIERLQLTPRLVAKLLTQSYQAQLVAVLASKPAKYQWVLTNPTSIVSDPDFVRFNPEFGLLTTLQAIDASGLVVEQPTSDAALALWQWVLADPEARRWLDGTPDEWGMKVNPIYSTLAKNNSNGTPFGRPLPTSFPKSDPYCYDSEQMVGSPAQKARPICLLDWSPYTLTMQAAARAAGAANSGARTTLDPLGTAETAWAANGPQRAGTRFILSLTDSASAARYGLQTAGLSRAGDDGPARSFITPGSESMLAAVRAMKPAEPTGQLVGTPRTNAPGAYPLTLLTYAATTPTSLEEVERRDYAAFIRFATGSGQTPGVAAGRLPPGYVPLPAALRTQAAAAIDAILHPRTMPTTTPTTQPPPTPDDGGGPSPIVPVGSDGFVDPGGAIGPADVPTGGTAPPVKTARLVEPAAVTKGVSSGAVRFALPLVVMLGLAALAASFRKPSAWTPITSSSANGETEPPPQPAEAPRPAPRRPDVFQPW